MTMYYENYDFHFIKLLSYLILEIIKYKHNNLIISFHNHNNIL